MSGLSNDREALEALILIRDKGYSTQEVMRTFALIEQWYETGTMPEELKA